MLDLADTGDINSAAALDMISSRINIRNPCWLWLVCMDICKCMHIYNIKVIPHLFFLSGNRLTETEWFADICYLDRPSAESAFREGKNSCAGDFTFQQIWTSAPSLQKCRGPVLQFPRPSLRPAQGRTGQGHTGDRKRSTQHRGECTKCTFGRDTTTYDQPRKLEEQEHERGNKYYYSKAENAGCHFTPYLLHQGK